MRKLALISTLPKSGTWYTHYFLYCYDFFLRNPEADIDLLKENQKGKFIKNKTSNEKSLGIKSLYLCHTICPGFNEIDKSILKKWEELKFWIPGYNWGMDFIGNDFNKLSPKMTRESKIVYLYRNPMDHFVSYYFHGLEHEDEIHRTKENKTGNRVPIKDIKDMVFEGSALDSFLKHYCSFYFTEKIYKNNILLVSYENLTRNPEIYFDNILSHICDRNHFGFFSKTPKHFNKKLHDNAFKKAIKNSSFNSIKKLENELNRSIVGDLKNKSDNRHLRDGATGKWKKYFSDSDLEEIEKKFNVFNLSLEQFVLD